MTEQELRAKYVKIAQRYIGCNEKDGSFKKIIDLYNAKKPKGYYTMKYTDHWCATFVSACAAEAGITSILPMECSCGRQIELFKKLGTWHEDENYVPKPGDIIYYDWQDGKNYATTDNKGSADHVGIVEVVNGNTITVIEGNASEAVKRLGYKINGRFLRGFGLPNFASLADKQDPSPITETVTKIVVPGGEMAAKEVAKNVDKSLKGTYRVTASDGLHIRDGSSVSSTSFMVLPLGTEVKNYGFFNVGSNGQKWMYVQVTYNGITYKGYCSGAYLAKV